MVQLLAWWLVTQLVKVTPSLEGAWAAWLHANAGLVERMLFAPEQVCGNVWEDVGLPEVGLFGNEDSSSYSKEVM